jgi:hypothetical protein
MRPGKNQAVAHHGSARDAKGRIQPFGHNDRDKNTPEETMRVSRRERLSVPANPDEPAQRWRQYWEDPRWSPGANDCVYIKTLSDCPHTSLLALNFPFARQRELIDRFLTVAKKLTFTPKHQLSTRPAISEQFIACEKLSLVFILAKFLLISRRSADKNDGEKGISSIFSEWSSS